MKKLNDADCSFCLVAMFSGLKGLQFKMLEPYRIVMELIDNIKNITKLCLHSSATPKSGRRGLSEHLTHPITIISWLFQSHDL